MTCRVCLLPGVFRYLPLGDVMPDSAEWLTACRLWSSGRCTLLWETDGLIAGALEGRQGRQRGRGVRHVLLIIVFKLKIHMIYSLKKSLENNKRLYSILNYSASLSIHWPVLFMIFYFILGYFEFLNTFLSGQRKWKFDHKEEIKPQRLIDESINWKSFWYIN